MIPKAQILELSRNYKLLPTTVEKDYIIGWLLRTCLGSKQEWHEVEPA